MDINDKESIGEGRQLAVVILAVLGTLFAALGWWQFQRAGEHSEMATRVAEAEAAPPLDLALVDVSGADSWRRAVAQGEFLRTQYFLEGQRESGRTGYHAIGVLRMGDGLHVLVDRGFVRRAEGGAPGGKVRLQGRLMPIAHPVLKWGDPQGPVRPYLDAVQISRELGVPLAPLLLATDAQQSRPADKRGLHIGYGVQWLVFAVVALVAATRLARRR